jgi:hypothetical protein
MKCDGTAGKPIRSKDYLGVGGFMATFMRDFGGVKASTSRDGKGGFADVVTETIEQGDKLELLDRAESDR